MLRAEDPLLAPLISAEPYYDRNPSVSRGGFSGQHMVNLILTIYDFHPPPHVLPRAFSSFLEGPSWVHSTILVSNHTRR